MGPGRETALNGPMLADMGVPLALVAGDDRLGEAIDDRFPDT